MKLLFLECQMGAAGDMLMGALFELLSKEEQAEFLNTMNQLPFPGVTLAAQSVEKCGIHGTKINISIHGSFEPHDHDHTPERERGLSREHTQPLTHHTHSHTSYTGVQELVSNLPIEKRVITDTLLIYRLIGEAEAKAHNKSIDQIHFHEVGTLDAIMDVIGCCILIHLLKPEKIIVSPIHVGYGTVHCAHGILPVPAPATAEILKDVPIYSKNIKGELCTPTGAAILKHFADEFSYMPEMLLTKTGYGMGSKDFETANCIRAFYGTEDGFRKQKGPSAPDRSLEKVVEISCNLDDMTPESLGCTIELLLENHVLDVYTTPVMMKKNRPAVILSCLCAKEAEEHVSHLLLKHTTTKGVRIQDYRRRTLDSVFKKIHTKYGEISMKIYSGDDVFKYKPEYEDIRMAARQHQLPFQQLYTEVMSLFAATESMADN